jgi:hypothetical protein
MVLALFSIVLVVGSVLEVRTLTTGMVSIVLLTPAVAGALYAIASGVHRRMLPNVDVGLLPALMTFSLAWWLTGGRAMGHGPGDLLSGLLLLGYDHSSHFTLFSTIYHDGAVWSGSSDLAPSSYADYPPLSAVISVVGALLIWGDDMRGAGLLQAYVQMSAFQIAAALALITWISAAAGASLARRPRRRSASLIAGFAVGGFLLAGTVLSFFDLGFANFVVAASVAAAASWLAAWELRRHSRVAALALASGLTTCALLWTPVMLTMVPAGLILARRVLRQRDWSSVGLGIALVVLVGSVATWQSRRIVTAHAADGSLGDALGTSSGGILTAPIFQAVVLVLLAGGMAFAQAGRRRGAWLALLAPGLGGLFVTAGIAAVALSAGTLPHNSYYVAKTVWLTFFVAVPSLGALAAAVALAFAAASRRRQMKRTPSRASSGNISSIVVGTLVVLVAWASVGGVPLSGGSLAFYLAVPVSIETSNVRATMFRDAAGGDPVLAVQSAARGIPTDRVHLVWESDQLANRWVSALQLNLSDRTNEVIAAVGEPPRAAAAREALAAELAQDDLLSVSVHVSQPESRRVLDPLLEEFGGRVRLVGAG